MKKNILLFLFSISSCLAQKELWGVNNDTFVPLSNADYFGNITKYDINGQNPVKMHEFNITDGRNPNGKLFQASNGKIYGVTQNGGINDLGVLYEYDLEINHYRVIHQFNLAGAQIKTGLIEPLPGKLYGSVGGRVFYYNTSTETVTYCTGITDNITIFGELVKSSNGNLYGTTIASTACQGIAPYYQQGTIFKVNLATNISQIVYRLNCNTFDGSAPVGGLIEASPGMLYGVTRGGGGFYNAGTLFEFDTATNVFTKKITFDENNLGAIPYPLVSGGNGKLYGVCRNGGTNVFTTNDGITYTTHNGALFEYIPTTNAINKLHDFGPINNNGTYTDSGVNPISLLKTTDGYYMGTGEQNPFKFDPANNTVVSTINAAIPFNTNRLLNFIEVCRKPTYHFFDVDTFDACVGGTFNYDVQNTNAGTYQWLKNGDNISNQTTGILNLINIAPSDAGDYTCLMTNECGATTTMVLHLTVNCLGTDTFADLDKYVQLHPNPTTDVLNIKLPENINVVINNVRIANSLGQIILETKIQNNPAIDVSQLQTGIYFIAVNTNYGVWKGKFLKE